MKLFYISILLIMASAVAWGVMMATHHRLYNRLNQLLDRAQKDDFKDYHFDETRHAALETKLYHFITANQAMLEKASQERESVKTLISDISHQTKTPIASLKLYSEWLNEAPLEDAHLEAVHAIHSQTEKLSFLIEALVKASRLETERYAFFSKNHSVDPLIEAAIRGNGLSASAKDIAIHFEPCGHEAYYDYKWTLEAIHNLIDNAIKYAPPKSHIQIKTYEYPLFTRMDVTDQGIGIEEHEIPHIFTRFYRSSEVYAVEGVGLGLYLTREIIQKQNGYLKVKSEKQKGSTFSIFLPTKQ